MSLAMQGGMLDLLRVVPQHGIDATICYLRRKIPEGEHTSKWDLFLDYFCRIWINGYDFELWNESEALAKGIDYSNKTNNCLENLNRQINNQFANAHPNIFTFIEQIRELPIQKVVEVQDIRRGGKRPCRQPVRSPKIPSELRAMFQ
jgi:hypothetical protein